MKFLVVYNNDFTTGKEFSDVNKAVDYIFEQVGKTGASKDDYKIYQGVDYEPKHAKEESVKGAEPKGTIYGVQMSIFDLPEMEKFKECIDECEKECKCECDEEIDENAKVVGITFSFDADKVNNAVNTLLKILNDNNLNFEVEDNILSIDLEELIANNLELDIETDKK